MILNSLSIDQRRLSYLNLLLIGGVGQYHDLYSISGGLALSTFLLSVARKKNPFDKLLQTIAGFSKESNYQMNYRNIDSFINFNEKDLASFITTRDKNEIYFTSLSNIARTLTFSYMIITRETIVNGLKDVIDPALQDRMFSLIEKHFYPLIIPHEKQTDLLKNCTCSTSDIHNIAMMVNYYKKNVQYNHKNKSKPRNLLSFLFQSHNYNDLYLTIMAAFKESGLNEILDNKGTNSTMYHNPSKFMVNKRIQKNYKEALTSNEVPSYLPEILGKVLGTINFVIRSIITGNSVMPDLFPSNPSIYLMNIQNMTRSTKINSIDEIQKTSALLDAINPSSQKAYICFSSNSNIDPALVNRHVFIECESKKNLICFFTALRRKVFQLKWKGLLTGEPIEEIVIKLLFATYGKYSSKDVGFAIEQRLQVLSQNRNKKPFIIDSILDSF